MIPIFISIILKHIFYMCTVKSVLSGHSKIRPKIGFQDPLLLNAGQKYCRKLPMEHSPILSTFIKLPIVFKTFVLSNFEWLLKTGFTVFPISFLARGDFCHLLITSANSLAPEQCRCSVFHSVFHVVIFTFSKQGFKESLNFCHRS